MATPQPGIFALGTRSHYYMELDLRPGADPAALAGALAALTEPRRTTGGANLVVGLAPSLWSSLAPRDCPAGAADFVPVEGPDGYRMPSTQHSAWIWAAAAGYDVVFDVARASAAALAQFATLADQVAGFAYRDSRDITGFVDGTENPPLDEAADVAVVPDGAPGEGASVVLVQRWEHDLAAFHALSLAEQEAVIGRTKADSVELDDDVKPASSHVARTVVEDEDGEELEVFRRSTSFGDVGTHGMVFVAFASRQAVTARMLARMAGAEDGTRDALTHYSRPVTGAFYVVPEVGALRWFSL
jgi:putative iron-dependent peroxidase